MSYDELCDECKQELDIGYVPKKRDHCHHQKVKPKCWCEGEGEKRIQKHIYTNGTYMMNGTTFPKFCPDCGRSLKQKKVNGGQNERI